MSDEMIGKVGYIGINSWDGLRRIRVTIVGVTPNRYHVRLEEYALWPGGRPMKVGDVTVVPKTAVRVEASDE